MRYSFLILAVLLVKMSSAQEIVFEGFPSKRVQSSFDQRIASDLSSEETREYVARVTKIGNEYFWLSRENLPLVRSESGIYITYFATNGSGYIRTLNPTAREVFITTPSNDQIGQVTYIEHLLLGLESITYYGR